MKKTNHAAVSIAWRAGEMLCAAEFPSMWPFAYRAAVTQSDALLRRLVRGY